MRITKQQAEALISAYMNAVLQHTGAGEPEEWIVSAEEDEPFGWEVDCKPRRWVETGDDEYLVIGVPPILVTYDAEVFMVPPSYYSEFYDALRARYAPGSVSLGRRVKLSLLRAVGAFDIDEARVHPDAILTALPDGSEIKEVYRRLASRLHGA